MKRSLRSGLDQSTRRSWLLAIAAGGAFAMPALADVVAPNFTETAADSGLNTAIRNAPRAYQEYMASVNFGSITAPTVLYGVQLRLAIGENWRPAGYVGQTWPDAPLSFSDYTIELSKASAQLIADGEYLSATAPFAPYQDSPVVVRSGPLSVATAAYAADGANPATDVHSWGPTIDFNTPYTINPGDTLVVMIRHPGYGATGTPLNAFMASHDYANGVADAVSSTVSATATAPNGFSSPIIMNFVTTPPAATGACCLFNGSCTPGATPVACAAAGGVFRGGLDCATAACVVNGACCKNDGTCSEGTQAACTAAGGAFQANVHCPAAACPPAGSCCTAGGACSNITSAACLAAGGTFGGPGSACATASCPGRYVESGDAGQLTSTAPVISGSGSLFRIDGTLATGIDPAGDVDMYAIRICDFANFSATTDQLTTIDTMMFLFDASGMGVVFNDDIDASPIYQSRVTNAFVTANGTYYLAVDNYARYAQSSGGAIFPTTFPGEFGPTGPGGASPLTGWAGTGTSTGPYGIALTGACYVSTGPTCYANCDSSTGVPFLNVGDFTCFLQKFAAADAYANCDGSTALPTLNVGDFTCFLQKFAAGCSAP